MIAWASCMEALLEAFRKLLPKTLLHKPPLSLYYEHRSDLNTLCSKSLDTSSRPSEFRIHIQRVKQMSKSLSFSFIHGCYSTGALSHYQIHRKNLSFIVNHKGTRT